MSTTALPKTKTCSFFLLFLFLLSSCFYFPYLRKPKQGNEKKIIKTTALDDHRIVCIGGVLMLMIVVVVAVVEQKVLQHLPHHGVHGLARCFRVVLGDLRQLRLFLLFLLRVRVEAKRLGILCELILGLLQLHAQVHDLVGDELSILVGKTNKLTAETRSDRTASQGFDERVLTQYLLHSKDSSLESNVDLKYEISSG